MKKDRIPGVLRFEPCVYRAAARIPIGGLLITEEKFVFLVRIPVLALSLIL